MPRATAKPAAKTPPAKKVEATQEKLSDMARAYREHDAPRVHQWAVELIRRLKLSPNDSTDLIAIGVCMSQHERATLLRILTHHKEIP